MMGLMLIYVHLFVVIQAQLKYHQTDYTVNINIVQLYDYNRSYLSNAKCDLVHYNRSYRAVNASAYLKKDLSMDLKLDIQLYKFLSNEYRFFPLTMTIDGCKEFERDTFSAIEALQPSVNIPLRCPIKKGFIAMTYGMVNFSGYPPYIPAGQYKTDTKLYDNSNYVLTTHGYYKVEEILKKWEN